MTLLGTYARYPVSFVRGEGARLWDEESNEYLDFLSGISVTSVGHCHPKVVTAVQEQVAMLTHTSNLYSSPAGVELAARLSASSLGGGVFFTNSGAEANEAALKLARKHRRGGEILSAHGAFHGRTFGALSATPQEAKQAPFAPLVGGFRAADAAALAGEVGPGTAAVILEAVQGESGVNILPAELLRGIRAACDEHGALLILDEVQTGMGRTGYLWAHQDPDYPVVPDVMTTAKALGGGLPIGAMVVAPHLVDVLEPGDHGSTFAGGPLVARAALAAFDVLDDPELLARVRELGPYFVGRLEELGLAARGRGLMVAADVDGAPALARRALLEQRLVINATGPGTLRFLPPLIIGEAEIDEAVGRLAALLG